MISICTLISFFLSALMFKINREKKIAIILCSVITLSLLRMPFLPGLSSANNLLCFCFLLSELNHINSFIKSIKQNATLKNFLIAILLHGFIACLFSPHLHSISEIIHYVIYEYLYKYFVIFYAYVSIKDEKNLKSIIKYSSFAMLILTAFGISNFIFNSNPVVTELVSNYGNANFDLESAGEKFTNQTRFRVQALFYNPFNYGYICSLMLIMYIYAYAKHFINRLLFIIMISCCLFGIFMCGCRTIVFCFIGSYSIFIIRAYQLGKFMKYITLFVILANVSYSFVPIIREKIDIALTAITDVRGDEVGGSSIEMRKIQFLAVLFHIQDHPFVGRGVHFFSEDLGWKDGFHGLKDSRLYGIEGVYLSQLLEHGILGYALYLYSWILLLVFFKRTSNKYLSAFGFSIIALYTIFANMTGELLSVFPTLLILGCIIKISTIIPNEKND